MYSPNSIKKQIQRSLPVLALLLASTWATADTYSYRVAAKGLTATPAVPAAAAAWAATGTPAVAFASTPIGNYAASDLSVSVKNTGNAAGSLPAPAFAGADAANFSASSSCDNIAANATCTVTARFKPLTAGAKSATLQVGTYALLTFTGTGASSDSDPYFANVSLLMHMEGANGGTSFADVKGGAYTAVNATISTETKQAGAASAYFNQTGSVIKSANSGALVFGTGDFTVEFYTKLLQNGYHQWFINSYNAAAPQSGFVIWRWYPTHGIQFGSYSAGAGSNVGLETGAWTHVAVSRVLGVSRLFFNGVVVGSFNDANNYTNPNVAIGGIYNQDDSPVLGNMDEVRVTKGIGRYSANFTPPTVFPDK